MVLWLQAKVYDLGLGIRTMLYSSPVCDDSAAEAAYATVVVPDKWALAFTFDFRVQLSGVFVLLLISAVGMVQDGRSS